MSSDDNGNGPGNSSHQNDQQQQPILQQNVEADLSNNGSSSNSNSNINNQGNQQLSPLPLPLPAAAAAEDVVAMDQSGSDNVNVVNNGNNNNNNNNALDLDVNIELVNNDEVLDPALDFDADAEEFRRRFYEAISRRNVQRVDSPPEYEEFDEDDNIDLIEEIIEDEDDDDSFDGLSTGPPSSRKDYDFDPDENALVDREEISSAVPVFDLQLPQLHSYLGDSMETLSGRTILEGGAEAEIPLVLLEFHLVPGQTLPLTIFHANVQSALRRCVPNNRHFGIVHSGLNDVNIRSPLPRRALGTTAEIYEFQEGRDEHESQRGGIGAIPFPEKISIKAKGRHRFNVLSTYRQNDGHLMAKVKIRPEISLPKYWKNLMSTNHRYMFPIYPLLRTSSSIAKTSTSCSGLRERRYSHSKPKHFKMSPTEDEKNKENENQLVECATASSSSSSSSMAAATELSNGPSTSLSATNTESQKMTKALTEARKINRFYSALTGWPYFVFEQFDEDVLVERIHRKLNAELSSLATASAIPHDATDLSFWLAQNLTMNDSLRLQMLKMDTSIERLRFASKLIDKVSRVIECNQCQAKIANHSDIFSMSVEGPQGTYVNPHGFVHELITVTKIKGTIYRGFASTEASWFPGYSWRIMECRGCSNHVGWKFKAKERLKPPKFYGLARRSVSFKYDFSLQNECPEL